MGFATNTPLGLQDRRSMALLLFVTLDSLVYRCARCHMLPQQQFSHFPSLQSSYCPNMRPLPYLR